MAVPTLYITWIWIIFVSHYVASQTDVGCKSPQYLEIGEVGIINCTLHNKFISVFWYNSPDTLSENSIIDLSRSIKSGPGWTSGEYDVHADGSLIINEVTVDHERFFSVAEFISEEDFPDVFVVDIKTTITPVPPYPIVDGCSNDEEICFKKGNTFQQLTCSVKESRPSIPVTWFILTGEQNKNISSTLDTSSTINTVSLRSLLMNLLVCKATDLYSLLDKDEIITLVKNESIDLSVIVRQTEYAELGSKITMECNTKSVKSFVWEKQSIDAVETLAVGVDVSGSFIQSYDDDYIFYANGSLMIDKVTTHHNSIYTCTSSNSTSESIITYHLYTYVNPVPPYPVVYGCNEVQNCRLQIEVKRNLTCTMNGIYPEVQLEWREQNTNKNDVTFTNQLQHSSKNGHLIDVILTTNYNVKSTDNGKVTIECRVIGTYEAAFPQTTTVELFLNNQDKTQNNLLGAMIISATVAVIVLAVGLIIWCKGCRKSKPNIIGTDEENSPLNDIYDNDTKQKTFIKILKQSYLSEYSAIKPVPMMKNYFHIKDIFIDGGISCLVTSSTMGKLGKWKMLSSIEDMTALLQKSKRLFVEGDPGYGKTMLALHFAYKWCVGPEQSFFTDFDLLILLKVRRIAGTKSIYEAIKKEFLQSEETISISDIENILQTSKSLIILDGYDEYTQLQSEPSMEFIDNICKSVSFSQSVVIVTMRSSKLPEEYDPQTLRMKLTGFDAKMQTKYLTKISVLDETEQFNKLSRILDAPSPMTDLLQIPLVFASFVHSIETDDQSAFSNAYTLAMFFGHVVTTFYSHLENKQLKAKCDDGIKHKHNNSLSKEAFTTLIDSKLVLSQTDEEFIEYYQQMGILKQSKPVLYEHLDKVVSLSNPNRHTITFYKSILGEWYAAQYLTTILQKHSSDTPDSKEETILSFLQDIDRSEFYYIFLFACGINPIAGDSIVSYLREIDYFDNYVLLCKIEQNQPNEKWRDLLKAYCSSEIRIGDEDEEFLQKSAIHLLVIASSEGIPVSNLVLGESLDVQNLKETELALTSNIAVPILRNLKQLTIDHDGSELFIKELEVLFNYISKCKHMTTLRFSNCLLPRVYKRPQIVFVQRLEVLWFPSVTLYNLNVSSGKWEYQNSKTELNEDGYRKEATIYGITVSTSTSTGNISREKSSLVSAT